MLEVPLRRSGRFRKDSEVRSDRAEGRRGEEHKQESDHPRTVHQYVEEEGGVPFLAGESSDHADEEKSLWQLQDLSRGHRRQ